MSDIYKDEIMLHPHLIEGVVFLRNELFKLGYTPVFAETFRSFERQKELYKEGKSTVLVGWHNFGLAVDIIDKYKGYNDPIFFKTAGAIWESIGGVWGGSWKNFPDSNHFEYSYNYSLSQWQKDGTKLAKILPRMNIPREVVPITPRFKTLDEVPSWARERVRDMINQGIIRGRTPDNLDITEDMIRTLIMFERWLQNG